MKLTKRELALDPRAIQRHELELDPAFVAGMTRKRRESRVMELIQASLLIVHQAETIYTSDKIIMAKAVLFSGGNDSTVLAHMMHMQRIATHAVHANTGIGIERTRQFVRDVCAQWGLPLVEKSPPPHRTFQALVLKEGFPGPAKHWKAYQWLKESALDAARVDLGVHRSRTLRALFIAGRRRSESARRVDVPMFESDGSVVWVSPMVPWTKLDLNTYRTMFNVPVNDVTKLIHHSGECGCGSFAQPGELEEWGDWYPEFRAEVERLESLIAHRTDIPEERKYWGWGAYRTKVRPPRRTSLLCGSCNIRYTTDKKG